MAQSIGQADIATMLEAFGRSPFAHLVVRAGTTRVVAGRPVAAADPEVATALIRAPRLGTFRAAQAAGARVDAGSVIGRVETRRTSAPVTSDLSGTVAALLVENGAFVEYGQPLARVHLDRSDAAP